MSEETPKVAEESVTVSVGFKKQNYPITIGLDKTVGDFRLEVEKQTNVPPGLQKLMFKGMLKDDSQTIRTAGFKEGAKLMLIGSTIQEVLSTAEVPVEASSSSSSTQSSEPLSTQLPHKKVIDKGIPDDIMAGKFFYLFLSFFIFSLFFDFPCDLVSRKWIR
eukprot:TRINITY_DN8733_c1_g1_i1.p1 TRINITY_DN8733_c1_g1~~TRINITY_DN8733_c1_g1_i1.p1  ORF type:complete len:162 (-),score=31.31 TRINITY_DN8733_c1_g1_i1:98-583(-)